MQNLGIRVTTRMSCDGAVIVTERNRLITQFLETECTHILCVDSDISWPSIAVEAMLNEDKDFIAGVYPSRIGDNIFKYVPTADPITGNKYIKDRHLIKADYVPAGFMLIKRAVIEKMIEKFPESHYTAYDDGIANTDRWLLFDTEIINGEFWGEDFVFCRKAREAGFDIWVDTYIQFIHADKVGKLANILAQEEHENILNSKFQLKSA